MVDFFLFNGRIRASGSTCVQTRCSARIDKSDGREPHAGIVVHAFDPIYLPTQLLRKAKHKQCRDLPLPRHSILLSALTAWSSRWGTALLMSVVFCGCGRDCLCSDCHRLRALQRTNRALEQRKRRITICEAHHVSFKRVWSIVLRNSVAPCQGKQSNGRMARLVRSSKKQDICPWAIC